MIAIDSPLPLQSRNAPRAMSESDSMNGDESAIVTQDASAPVGEQTHDERDLSAQEARNHGDEGAIAAGEVGDRVA